MRQLARWLFAGVLVFLIVRYLQSNPQALQAIGALESWRIALAVALFMIAISIHAWRTYLIIRSHTASPLRYMQWLRLITRARVLNLLGSQLGNVYRALRMKQDFEVAYTSYISSMGFFTWVDTASNLVLALITLSCFGLLGATLPISAGQALLALLLWLAILPGVSALERLLASGGKGNTLILHARRFLQEFRAKGVNRGLVIRLFGLGILSFANLAALYALVFHGINAEVALYQVVVIVVLYKLSLVVTLTPGNVGITEWTVAGACLLVGVDAATGLLAALLMRAFNLAALAAMALLGGLSAPAAGQSPEG